jgi:hypothetical protein
MRILIADRNGRLLESISRTFAPDFTITTAMSLRRCTDLLLRGDFDLAIISEKLSDGPGLRLLGHIASHSPATLRVLTARRSRLEALGGRLRPLGLFRTLAYPIDAQKLSSTLTLARAGANGKPTSVSRSSQTAPAPIRVRVPVPVPAQAAAVRTPTVPAPLAARRFVERIRFTFADAILATNVPMLIPAMVVRRSDASSVARQGSIAPRIQLTPARIQPAAFQSAALQPAPPRAQTAALQSTSSPVQSFAPPRARSGVAPARSAARLRKPSLLLPVTLAAGLAALALILHSPDVPLARDPISRLAKQPADLATVSRQNPAPASATLPFTSASSSAKRVEPNPTPTTPDAEQAQPEIAANTAPVADPSTFGSEAYESIYSN